MDDTKKRYEFLRRAEGVKAGQLYPTTFQKGDVAELDEGLAEQFFHQGVIEETTKAVGGQLTEAASPDQSGEAGIPTATQRIEELVSVARDHYGLDVDSTMDADVIRDMIEAAKGGAAKRETKVEEPEETKPAHAAEHKKPARKAKH